MMFFAPCALASCLREFQSGTEVRQLNLLTRRFRDSIFLLRKSLAGALVGTFALALKRTSSNGQWTINGCGTLSNRQSSISRTSFRHPASAAQVVSPS
eukprot:scaffold2378_cov137-Skeletonema_dohrnii-CCMP3373.AAC.7